MLSSDAWRCPDCGGTSLEEFEVVDGAITTHKHGSSVTWAAVVNRGNNIFGCAGCDRLVSVKDKVELIKKEYNSNEGQ